MKRARWGCCKVARGRLRSAWWRAFAVALWVVACGAGPVSATILEFGSASMLVAPDPSPPGADRDWIPVTLPRTWTRSDLPALTGSDAIWYRIRFDHPHPERGGRQGIYLPYLVSGGRIWMNGFFVVYITQTTADEHARWERPQMVIVPQHMLRNSANELLIRVPLSADDRAVRFSSVSIGWPVELLPPYQRRLFWMRTMPQITVVVSLLIAGFVLFIWWRRRSEVLYGLFGVAAALWGVRTLTFVVEVLPTQQWQLWRLAVLAATLGFIIVLAIFTLRLAHIRVPWIERALIAYWAIGPIFLLTLGRNAEPLVNQVWTGGTIPVGLSVLVLSFWIVWRQRTVRSAAFPVALTLAVFAGIHDWLIAWYPGLVGAFFPSWVGHRIFLLYHAANLLLLTMGGILTARFIEAIDSLEILNRTLESRVADRESALAANYEELAALQREKAAAEERQLIMRDLHDGLGSQLFTSLSRVERGDMNEAQVAAALRDCIADMRLALDALASQSSDVGSTLANFMFRWETLLRAAGVQPRWDIDTGLDAYDLTSHDALQVLRIAQEALTNVLKHAHATQVAVRLTRHDDELRLEIKDNGAGIDHAPARHSRGLLNMQYRAERLGGRLDLRSSPSGTCVELRLHLQVPAHAGRAAHP